MLINHDASTDNQIENVSVGLGKIALSLTSNPDLFNELMENKEFPTMSKKDSNGLFELFWWAGREDAR